MKKKVCIFEKHLDKIKKLNSINNYDNNPTNKINSINKSYRNKKITYISNGLEETSKSSEIRIKDQLKINIIGNNSKEFENIKLSPDNKKKQEILISNNKKNLNKQKSIINYEEQISIFFSKNNIKKENQHHEEIEKEDEFNKNRQTLINKINKALGKGVNIFTKINLFEEVETEEFDNPKYREYMEDRILCEFISKNINTSNNIIGQELTNSYHHLKSNSSISINSINNYSPVNKRINKSKKERTFSLSNNEQLISEDNKKSEKIILFGIFDGHGGYQISSKLLEILPKEIHSRINTNTNESHIKQMLIDSFEKTDKELMTKITECDDIGSTGSIAFLMKYKSNRILYIANIGDSHIYIISNKKALRLTKEHKCTVEEEILRVKEKNALIYENRLFGQLALTRAFCDRKLKPYGLVATPFVNSYIIKEKSISNKNKNEQDEEYDVYIVLASDGIWDVVNDENLIQILIEDGKNKSTKELCKNMIDYSIKNGSKDNISIIIIKL